MLQALAEHIKVQNSFIANNLHRDVAPGFEGRRARPRTVECGKDSGMVFERDHCRVVPLLSVHIVANLRINRAGFFLKKVTKEVGNVHYVIDHGPTTTKRGIYEPRPWASPPIGRIDGPNSSDLSTLNSRFKGLPCGRKSTRECCHKLDVTDLDSLANSFEIFISRHHWFFAKDVFLGLSSSLDVLHVFVVFAANRHSIAFGQQVLKILKEF